MNLESHVTVKCPEKRIEELRGLIECVDWSFSEITGDPLLGTPTFCYATTHFTDLAKAIGDTAAMAVALEIADFLVVRMKVEAVMWDKRRIDGEWKEIQ